jgi:hypothetical protein
MGVWAIPPQDVMLWWKMGASSNLRPDMQLQSNFQGHVTWVDHNCSGDSRNSEIVFLYYEEGGQRDLNTRLIYECRCDERLKAKTERSTRLTYTVLCGGQIPLKIKTRLIDKKFASVMGECVFVKL